MKKIFNKSIIFIIFLFSFIVLTTDVFAYDKVTDTSQKIYDFGNLLSDDEEKYLKGLIDDYISKYNYDMVIVTKSNYSADSTAMMNYADDFYDYNGFGIGKTHDGILLFLNVDNYGPVVWISTTGNAIITYNDSRISSLKSYMSNAKSSGNRAIVEAFIKQADNYASKGTPSNNKNAYIDENGNIHYKKSYPFFPFIIVSALVASITICIMVFKNKMVKSAAYASQYLDTNSLNINNRQDIFVTTHTSRVRMQSSSGGGGSSTHRSSSGRSHGGGGGRL